MDGGVIMKKLLAFAAAAALAFATPALAQQHDTAAGGGVLLNLTAGSIDCNASGTSGCTIKPNTLYGITGTTAADSVNAGGVGELLTTTVATASAVALTTATAADVMTVSLTPGDWDVAYQVRHKPAASTSITILSCSLSTTTNTMGTQPGGSGIGTDSVTLLTQAAQVNAGEITQASIPVRVSLAATTTIRVVCNDTFTVSTMGAYGTVRARRVR
jgi:hypothetical protein